MIYLDTSILVSSMTNEIDTHRAQAALSQEANSRFYISDWSITEFSSALCMKQRVGGISSPDARRVRTQFYRMIDASLEVLEVSSRHFTLAAQLVENPELVLRAGDALHLAIVSDHQMPLYTLDKKLARAGSLIGVITKLL